jgi:DNA-binding CsgD family transcriptional regulator
MTTDVSDISDDDDSPVPTRGPLPLLLIAFLCIVMIGGVTDLVLDAPDTWLSWHVAVELLMVTSSAAFMVLFFLRWRASSQALAATRASLADTTRQLSERQAERDAWRASAEQALAGFGTAIDQQFVHWQLTRAEREVALLLLKGLGHKQVAARLGRAERTVRQQAVEVYRKAGLQGRSELAAFFLHDVELP